MMSAAAYQSPAAARTDERTDGPDRTGPDRTHDQSVGRSVGRSVCRSRSQSLLVSTDGDDGRRRRTARRTDRTMSTPSLRRSICALKTVRPRPSRPSGGRREATMRSTKTVARSGRTHAHAGVHAYAVMTERRTKSATLPDVILAATTVAERQRFVGRRAKTLEAKTMGAYFGWVVTCG